MSIAKAVAWTIGSALLGLLVTALAIPEWALDNLAHHAFQTIVGFLISAAFGGAVVFIAYATYITWRLGDRPIKAFKSLKKMAFLEDCKSLESMAETIKQLDETSRQIDEKDREIELLKKQLERDCHVSTNDGPLPVSIETIKNQPWSVANALYEALESSYYRPIASAPSSVLRSMTSSDGIFKREVTYFNGMATERDTYYVTPEWKLFFDDRENMNKLRIIARRLEG